MSKTVEERLAALEAFVASLRAAVGGDARSAGSGRGNVDLDSKYGNARVKYALKPKYWPTQPDPFVGKMWSQCSAEYLDATAKYLDSCAYMARKDGGADNEKKAHFKELDAERCRGWAARIRDGYVPPAEPESSFASGGNDQGFGSSSSGFGSGDSDSFNYGANANADDEGDIPFVIDATLYGRNDRP